MNRSATNRRIAVVLFLLMTVVARRGLAQDTVNVTFYYHGASSPAAYVTGEFNGWNSTGNPLTYLGNSTWSGTVQLRSNQGVFTPGAIEYKFFYTGAGQWPNDPLNPRSDASHNTNSILSIRNPTIYQLATTDQIAGNSLLTTVKTNRPVISSYVFPKINTVVDTSTITLRIDTTLFTGLGSSYNFGTQQFQYQVPVYLANGAHKAYVSAGGTMDSVSFTVQAGSVQILTHGSFSTRYASRTILGVVQDTSIHRAKLIRVGVDTVATTVTNGNFSVTANLNEGLNTFRALVDTPALPLSDPITITRIVDHQPTATVQIRAGASNTVVLSATSSTDPDGHGLTYTWLDDARSPMSLTGLTDTAVAVAKPSQPGEYYFQLVARDSLANADTTTTYFAIENDGSLTAPGYASSPSWVKQARIYFAFPKAASAAGNIAGTTALLPHIKSMGFSVVWLMPIMKNASTIDQGYGPGYNIVDFYNIPPEYGTNADVQTFMTQAHALGLKVILDITPNHTSRYHPFSLDAHTYHQYSPYWSWYQHAADGTDTRGLNWGTDADGFVYYGGFGDQLLNYNWSDIDARTEMIKVYKYWIQKYGVDGFRFDVYWGPHNRYGEANWGIPVRTALKHIKPDILLLGETDGTGGGSENNYADKGAGCDLAYDWILYGGAVKNFGFSQPAITNLHNDIRNGGYWPGPSARYLRFMENQDEDVIFYNNPGPTTYYDANATTAFTKTMPMASVIFTAPGVPQIWNGQEVGWGYGISGAKEARNRSTINWNFSGKTLLQPHYQKIAQIRGQFPAFWTQQMFQISTDQPLVYAFSRPFAHEDAIVAVNFGPSTVTATLSFDGSSFGSGSVTAGKSYVVTDLYRDTTCILTFPGWSTTFPVTIGPYGSAIMIMADSARTLNLPVITGVKDADASLPANYALEQNYPNPFNPTTGIRYQVPAVSGQRSVVSGQLPVVSLKIYDMLGREVATLVNGPQTPGTHTVIWNAASHASGVYFVRMEAGSFVSTRKMVLMK